MAFPTNQLTLKRIKEGQNLRRPNQGGQDKGEWTREWDQTGDPWSWPETNAGNKQQGAVETDRLEQLLCCSAGSIENERTGYTLDGIPEFLSHVKESSHCPRFERGRFGTRSLGSRQRTH